RWARVVLVEGTSTHGFFSVAGELDFTGSIPLPQFDWIKQNLGKELHISPYLTTYYYGLNLTRPPFASNPKLRQALAMAVDREILTEHITGTGELPAYGWVPPGTNYYTPQSFAWANLSPQARIAEAQRLYAEAGYSREQPLRAELRYNTADLHRRVAVAVAEMWKEHLGVELTLVNEEFRVMIQNIREKQVTEIFRSSWIGDYNDAFTFSQFLHSNFGLNLVGYTNPKYDALLEQAGAETDLRRRRALLEEAERLGLSSESVPLLAGRHAVDTPLFPCQPAPGQTLCPWVARQHHEYPLQPAFVVAMSRSDKHRLRHRMLFVKER
ncbi:MAG: peptide ABC transporter substrate-binding protein, partial [Gammaproteobacteria bacterium]